MNMLKEKSRNIQFEAFHVFKVKHLRKLYSMCDIILLFCVYRYLSLTLTSPSPYSTFCFVIKTSLLSFWLDFTLNDLKMNSSMTRRLIWLNKSKSWNLLRVINDLGFMQPDSMTIRVVKNKFCLSWFCNKIIFLGLIIELCIWFFRRAFQIFT